MGEVGSSRCRESSSSYSLTMPISFSSLCEKGKCLQTHHMYSLHLNCFTEPMPHPLCGHTCLQSYLCEKWMQSAMPPVTDTCGRSMCHLFKDCSWCVIQGWLNNLAVMLVSPNRQCSRVSVSTYSSWKVTQTITHSSQCLLFWTVYGVHLCCLDGDKSNKIYNVYF